MRGNIFARERRDRAEAEQRMFARRNVVFQIVEAKASSLFELSVFDNRNGDARDVS